MRISNIKKTDKHDYDDNSFKWSLLERDDDDDSWSGITNNQHNSHKVPYQTNSSNVVNDDCKKDEVTSSDIRE